MSTIGQQCQQDAADRGHAGAHRNRCFRALQIAISSAPDSEPSDCLEANISVVAPRSAWPRLDRWSQMQRSHFDRADTVRSGCWVGCLTSVNAPRAEPAAPVIKLLPGRSVACGESLIALLLAGARPNRRMVLDRVPRTERQALDDHAGRRASFSMMDGCDGVPPDHTIDDVDNLMQPEKGRTSASAPDCRSWDELVDTLRTAAGDVRSAIGRVGSSSTDDDVAAARLKGECLDWNSLPELISKISAGLRERQSEIDTTFDRERAQLSVEQMKSSLEELATLRKGIRRHRVGRQRHLANEPELKNVARAPGGRRGRLYPDWAAIDPTREQPGKQSSQNRLPLDDL